MIWNTWVKVNQENDMNYIRVKVNQENDMKYMSEG